MVAVGEPLPSAIPWAGSPAKYMKDSIHGQWGKIIHWQEPTRMITTPSPGCSRHLGPAGISDIPGGQGRTGLSRSRGLSGLSSHQKRRRSPLQLVLVLGLQPLPCRSHLCSWAAGVRGLGRHEGALPQQPLPPAHRMLWWDCNSPLIQWKIGNICLEHGLNRSA